MSKTEIRHGEFAGMPRLHVHMSDRTPSWKRWGEGVANIQLYGRPGSGRAELSASETALARAVMEEKRDVTKEVMFSLTPEAVRALRDQLNVILGEG